jgi:hypothetical protein
MRINRSVIFAVGIAGALSGFKKGDKGPMLLDGRSIKLRSSVPLLFTAMRE